MKKGLTALGAAALLAADAFTVDTYDLSGDPAPRGFSLIAACGN